MVANCGDFVANSRKSGRRYDNVFVLLQLEKLAAKSRFVVSPLIRRRRHFVYEAHWPAHWASENFSPLSVFLKQR